MGVTATRIMGRPVGACIAIKVVVLFQSSIACRANQISTHGHATGVPSSVKDKLIWNVVVAFVSNIFDDATL